MRGGAGAKYTCRFFLGIENDNDFHIARRIIGHGGSKMKDIVERSGGDAKLRLRGKGSGFVERDLKVESPEPLQLCISCPRKEGYEIAVRYARELLEDVYGEYTKWCEDNNLPDNTPEIKMTEKHHKEKEGGAANYGRPRSPPRQQKGRDRQRPQATHAIADRPSDDVPAPPGAPSVEDIKRAINDRNEARKRGDYREADRIRDDLRDRKVVLSDEKGAQGNPQNVTTWRYWAD
jgi:hypothetical protein